MVYIPLSKAEKLLISWKKLKYEHERRVEKSKRLIKDATPQELAKMKMNFFDLENSKMGNK